MIYVILAGAFATVGKKKKGKKGKNEPEDIPPPPPPAAPESAWDTLDLGANATADAGADDDWGGFTTAKTKKKGKKGKVRALSSLGLFSWLSQQETQLSAGIP